MSVNKNSTTIEQFVSNGIACSSKRSRPQEIKEMIDFTIMAELNDVSHLVDSLHYDGSCTHNITLNKTLTEASVSFASFLLDEEVSTHKIDSDVMERIKAIHAIKSIAYKTLSQFLINDINGEDICHGEHLDFNPSFGNKNISDVTGIAVMSDYAGAYFMIPTLFDDKDEAIEASKNFQHASLFYVTELTNIT